MGSDELFLIMLVGVIITIGGCVGSDIKVADIKRDCAKMHMFRSGEQVYNCELQGANPPKMEADKITK